MNYGGHARKGARDNVIITEYQKLPSPGPCPMPDDLRTTIEEAKKPKRGAKRKGKVGPSKFIKTSKKKVKKVAQKPRSPSPILEPSESRTNSDFCEGEHVQNELKILQLLWNHQLQHLLLRYLLHLIHIHLILISFTCLLHLL